VARGEGRFEPRTVKLGLRGQDYTEITEGIAAGEDVVVSANFLIDAESNLRAALSSFTADETTKPEQTHDQLDHSSHGKTPGPQEENQP
jgi:Cu(I)/Ag(I) efflux system membrane fusion protein